MTISEKVTDDALSWIMKEKEGLSQDEKQDLEEFLGNTLNKQTYDKCENLFASFTKLEEEDKNSIKADIEKDKRFSKFSNIFAPIAASILLVSFLSYFYYKNETVVYEKAYQAYNTKKVNIRLPDDSLIDLDVKSTLNIKYYKHKRLVNFPLGKAVFSIRKDKKRPFIIKSRYTQIEVIGTQFEVINLGKINTINVIEGIVRVSHVSNDKIKHLIVLNKGQSFSTNDQGKRLNLKDINISNVAKWKNDLIQFKNATLQEAFDKFQRYTDKKITLKDYKVANFKISGVFSTKEFDKFIDALPEIYPLKVIKNKYEIELISIVE